MVYLGTIDKVVRRTTAIVSQLAAGNSIKSNPGGTTKQDLLCYSVLWVAPDEAVGSLIFLWAEVGVTMNRDCVDAKRYRQRMPLQSAA